MLKDGEALGWAEEEAEAEGAGEGEAFLVSILAPVPPVPSVPVGRLGTQPTATSKQVVARKARRRAFNIEFLLPQSPHGALISGVPELKTNLTSPGP
jgi:hypothetical protein